MHSTQLAGGLKLYHTRNNFPLYLGRFVSPQISIASTNYMIDTTLEFASMLTQGEG